MVFSSLTFLYFYLPVVLGIYYVLPRKLRNGALLFVNLVFYGWGEPKYIWIMLVTTLANYACGLLIDRFRGNKLLCRLFLLLSVVSSLGFLMYFKYFAFLVESLQNIGLFNGAAPGAGPLPIGISFYTFQAMSYTIDVYRNDTAAQKSPVVFGTYISLFPQLIAGPIVRYKDVERQLLCRRESVLLFTDGIQLFVIGLAKKVLIANQMGVLWDSLLGIEEKGIAGAWIGAAAYAFQIYFDFSGYSDMARGLGKMFGFDFMVNFNYPYVSKSITEFWRRWHISLSTWFRDYVYIPLGGSRKGPARTVLNLLAVWFFTGFWHGASYNFILWGLYFFVLLILEKFVLGKLLAKLPALIRHLYTMLLVLFGWLLFYFEDMGELAAYIKSMFRWQDGLLGHDAGVLIAGFLPLLILALVSAGPLGHNLAEKCKPRPWFVPLAATLCLLGLLAVTALLVSSSYNPFLYFRF